ncbi:MAG: hypothetical protein ACIARR_09680 [Phycisphaerales bacterium JB059]
MPDESDMTTPSRTPEPPASLRRAVLGVSLILGLSSLGGLALAGAGAESVVIGMLGFEVVVFVAAVIAVLAGLGRFTSGYGLALACVAGTVLGASVLGFVDGRPNFVSSPDLARALEALVLVRLGVALALAALASLVVFVRRRSSWGYLGRGLLVGAPVVIAGGLVGLFARGWVLTPREGAMEAIRVGSIILGAMVLGGFFCASVHLIIRAYQAGDLDASPENSGV